MKLPNVQNAEIPRAKDLAERVEAQVGPEGIAPRIREVSEENDRESTALIIAKELAGELKSKMPLSTNSPSL